MNETLVPELAKVVARLATAGEALPTGDDLAEVDMEAVSC
jgi:hypothetical protein